MKEPDETPEGYQISELVQYLQTDSSVKKEDLLKIEFHYLTLLDGYQGSTPKTLEYELANNPVFFHETLSTVYRTDHEDFVESERSSEEKLVSTNAWQLFHNWKTLPGMQTDGSFDDRQFKAYMEQVKVLCEASGHLDTAMVTIGQMLVHAPPDPSGLWIHCTVAELLNARDAEMLRSGFLTGTLNERGVHNIDPSGKPEMDFAARYRQKADEVGRAKYHRLAETLRIIATSYARDAEWIRDGMLTP